MDSVQVHASASRRYWGTDITITTKSPITEPSLRPPTRQKSRQYPCMTKLRTPTCWVAELVP